MDQTGIFNLALGRVGIGQVVQSPTETTVPAKTCNRFYEQARREVLREFPYNFALRAEPLALVADEEFPGWGYVYSYPNDCLKIRAVGDSAGMRIMRDAFLTCRNDRYSLLARYRIPWQTGLRADGVRQVILCDVRLAWSFHTVDVTNTGVFPADVASVIAWRLAMEIGGPLKADAGLINTAKQEYLYWSSHAQANSLNEARDDETPDSPSITCRQ